MDGRAGLTMQGRALSLEGGERRSEDGGLYLQEEKGPQEKV